MTTHELARQLLAMDDVPVVHHYVYDDSYNDIYADCYSEVEIIVKDGRICISGENM